MAPRLQDLPEELLVAVLGYLPKTDLKSARLTCIRCGYIGAQGLFQRVYFAPRRSAIETFLSISANPTFARTVTELVYDGRLFLPELTAYKPYRKAFDAHICYQHGEDNEDIADAEQAGDGDGSTSNVGDDTTTRRQAVTPGCLIKGPDLYHETLADTLVRYTRLVDQQQSILEDKKDYEALCTGLKNLPNITTVIALDKFAECCDWVPLRADDHSRYHQRSELEIAVPIAPSSWARAKTIEDGEIRKWDVRGIQSLMRAVSKHCQEVTGLYIGSELSNAPMSMFEMDQDDYEDACTMAQRLTCLKMDLYVSRSDSEDEGQEQYDCLNGFLSEATELRCLATSGRIDSSLFNGKVWPHLEILIWGDLGLEESHLKAITRAHKGTLRELTLRNVYLFGAQGWADAAKEIGKYLKLRRVSVLGVCDEVTREGTADPYLEDDINLAVARSFMQSIPRTILLDENSHTIIACPGEDSSLVEIGHSQGP
ncbi:hypothetical protein HO133_008898 [Letharia lupina]|uniref:F-box domain-containing protein n=1 Tax=Letharia lupina TaxID=560253 RepID=A0A8H6CQ55_9LECA|nr:uncharacterized protein HO133_008898 [Letharia lupina]KAF6227454.1 hypothetical protein HO133_008898 [Letharia lupina]